jgi:hypothetical protein
MSSPILGHIGVQAGGGRGWRLGRRWRRSRIDRPHVVEQDVDGGKRVVPRQFSLVDHLVALVGGGYDRRRKPEHKSPPVDHHLAPRANSNPRAGLQMSGRAACRCARGSDQNGAGSRWRRRWSRGGGRWTRRRLKPGRRDDGTWLRRERERVEERSSSLGGRGRCSWNLSRAASRGGGGGAEVFLVTTFVGAKTLCFRRWSSQRILCKPAEEERDITMAKSGRCAAAESVVDRRSKRLNRR